MKDTAKLAEQYDVRLHTHLAETIDEENFCLEKYGLRTVDYLESVGWLSGRTWLAHGIHFNEQEIKKLGQSKVGICHCPSSNMIAELRQAMYLQRLRYGASKITHQHAYDWASKGSARLLGRGDIGEIATGKQADLALFKLDELRDRKSVV